MASVVSIILAAGKGKRMGSPDLPKVCHNVGGEPAIRRAIRTYDECGVEAHLVVVGPGAEQVIQAVAGAPGQHLFCYQPAPLGTGNAARIASDTLKAIGYQGDVLLVAGDKVIDRVVVRRLLQEEACDLAFVTGPAEAFPTSGRVVVDAEGNPEEIVEVPDLPSKPTAAGAKWANLSVYLFRADALYRALESLSTSNAQGEEYLTDTLRANRQAGGTTRAVPVEDPRLVMGFNTPQELETIRAYVETREHPCGAREWLTAAEPGQMPGALGAIHGRG